MLTRTHIHYVRCKRQEAGGRGTRGVEGLLWKNVTHRADYGKASDET